MFYSIYVSKHNRESMLTLKDTFTVEEFMKHKEFITICEDLEEESYKQARDTRK